MKQYKIFILLHYNTANAFTAPNNCRRCLGLHYLFILYFLYGLNATTQLQSTVMWQKNVIIFQNQPTSMISSGSQPIAQLTDIRVPLKVVIESLLPQPM